MKRHLIAAALVFSSVTFAAEGETGPGALEEMKSQVAPSEEKKPEEPKLETKKVEEAKPEGKLAAPSKDTLPTKTMDDDASYGKKNSFVPDLNIGPRITIIDFPRPLRAGVEVLYKKLVGGGFDFGYLPLLKIQSENNIKVGYDTWSVVGRVYPWQKRFFVGCYFGKMNLEAQAEGTYASIPARVNIQTSATFFTPHIGWRFVFDSGLFFSFEIGAHLPTSSESRLAVTPNIGAVNADPEFQKAKTDIEDIAKKVAKTSVPAVTLLQVGWYF